MIDFHTADTAEKLAVVDVMKGLKDARQIAYGISLKWPEFERWYERANEVYLDFCGAYGVTAEEVYDADLHIRRMIAEGHPDYVESYGKMTKYADVKPFSLPRTY